MDINSKYDLITFLVFRVCVFMQSPGFWLSQAAETGISRYMELFRSHTFSAKCSIVIGKSLTVPNPTGSFSHFHSLKTEAHIHSRPSQKTSSEKFLISDWFVLYGCTRFWQFLITSGDTALIQVDCDCLTKPLTRAWATFNGINPAHLFFSQCDTYW